MRIQFYPSEKLEKKLINEAEQLEVSVSILVNDLLTFIPVWIITRNAKNIDIKGFFWISLLNSRTFHVIIITWKGVILWV